MIYCELPLPEPLRRVALCAWHFRLEEGDPPILQHQVPPDGTTGLTLIRSGEGLMQARLVGPMLAAFTVPVMKGFDYAGLRLRPEMGAAFSGTEQQPGTSAFVALNGRWGAVVADLLDLVLGGTDWLQTIAFTASLPAGDEAVAHAVDNLIDSGGNMSVARLAALAHLSERQFRRRFHAATGISPKQYADVQRIRRALILSLEDPDWAGVAHDSGFADQAHLARDVKLRFGAAPRRVSGYFCGIRHELIEHAGVRNLQAAAARAA